MNDQNGNEVTSVEHASSDGQNQNGETSVQSANLEEKFINACRPLMTISDDERESVFTRLRALVNKHLIEDPKFRERNFYKELFEEALHIIETNSYSDINHQIKEVLDELKYNVPSKAAGKNAKEIKANNKKIKSLRIKLRKLHRKARKYAELEVNLFVDEDKLVDTAYLKEESYSKRILNTIKKIKQLENKTLKLGLKMEKKYVFSDTPYPEINAKITELVNDMVKASYSAKKQKRLSLLAAPSFETICETVQKVIDHEKLVIFDTSDLCKRILKKLGEDMKARRQDDYEYDFDHFGSVEYLRPEEVSVNSEELEPKFKDNEKRANDALADIIKKYGAVGEEDEAALVADNADKASEKAEESNESSDEEMDEEDDSQISEDDDDDDDDEEEEDEAEED